MELGTTLIHNLLFIAAGWLLYHLPFRPFNALRRRTRQYFRRKWPRRVIDYGIKPHSRAWLILCVALLAFSVVKIHQGAFEFSVTQSVGSPKPTQISVGPAGNLWANDHSGIVRSRVDVEPLDSSAVKQTAKDGDVQRVTGPAPDWRAIAWKVLGGTLAAIMVMFALFALFNGKRREITLTGLHLSLVVMIAYVPVATSFNANAFKSALNTPGSRDGLLADIPSNAVDQLGDTENKIGQLWKGTFQPRLESALSAYQTINPTQPGDIVLLHGSDVHDLTWGMDFMAVVARSFNVDAVLDTGDTASFGQPEETTTIPPYVRKFYREDSQGNRQQIPYLYVRGNHDKPEFAYAMAANGATVLDGGAPVSVSGLNVYGLGEPACSVCTPMTETQIEETGKTANPTIAQAIATWHPDIVMVHDAGMVQQSFGAVPVVESGHYHADRVNNVDGTWVMEAGTAGAGGFSACDRRADGSFPQMSVQVETLRPGKPVTVVSYLQVTLVPCDPGHLGSMGFGVSILTDPGSSDPLANFKGTAAGAVQTGYFCSI